MGWENYHLHIFRFGEKEYGVPDPDYPTEMRNEKGRRLREFLRDEGVVFGYEYDFGDGWEHDLVFERIVTGVEVTDAVCLEGGEVMPPGRCRRSLRIHGLSGSLAGHFPSGPPGDGGMEGTLVQSRAVRSCEDQPSIIPSALESPVNTY